MTLDYTLLQWLLVIGSSLALFWIAPNAKSVNDFFKGSRKDRSPNFWLLTSSLVISWLFAKSITNAANLGLSFGIVGGLAYAAYYLSFVVAGIVIYQLRSKGGFKSIHHFLETKYGFGAIALFSLLIGIRLFNEVWSNTIVIGSYFGEVGTKPYYSAILVFTFLTLAYSIKGGMSSSILTDLIQMVLFGLILVVLLVIIIPKTDGGAMRYVKTGVWSWGMGLNLLWVAIIQSLSYPFHDPVMTDRGFIADKTTTLRSFIAAFGIGAICILLFSFIGIYGQLEGVEGQAAVGVAKLLGVPMMLLINFIMITSAASTLDSTFSSFSKLIHLDLKKEGNPSLSGGRKSMIIITILGTIPVFLKPEILTATTVSGTMVIGLAPVFLFWFLDAPKFSFYGAVGAGLGMGVVVALGLYPTSWHFTGGKYADLLSANIIGSLACFFMFFIPYFMTKMKTSAN
ncbi:MAG: sodium:solute symporter [Saprospiraceae bacterium]